MRSYDINNINFTKTMKKSRKKLHEIVIQVYRFFTRFWYSFCQLSTLFFYNFFKYYFFANFFKMLFSLLKVWISNIYLFRVNSDFIGSPRSCRLRYTFYRIVLHLVYIFLHFSESQKFLLSRDVKSDLNLSYSTSEYLRIIGWVFPFPPYIFRRNKSQYWNVRCR